MIVSLWHSAISLASINACMTCTISLACSESLLLTQHNQESAQWPADPFPRERVGSGHETNSPFTLGIRTVPEPF